MADRLPPHNAEAEASLIGSALAYGSRAIDFVGSLRIDDFFLPEHRAAWEAILAAAGRRGAQVDVLTVESEIKRIGAAERFAGGWLTWASAAAGKASVLETLGNLSTMVREAAAFRKLIAKSVEWQAMGYGGATRWEDALTDLRNTSADLETFGSESETVHVYDVFREVATEIENQMASKSKPRVITTGLPTLDHIVDDLEGGQIVVIAARPGCGKTALACCISQHLGMVGIPALFFSLEMARKRIARRMISAETKMSTKQLRGGLTYEDWGKITKAAGRYEKAQLWINDSAMELPQIIGESRRWHAKYVRGRTDHRAAIFVDYAQLVETVRQKGQNREQEVAGISRGLKGLSRRTNAVVFLLAQLNRESEKRGGVPLLSDLRESGSLEQDADVILFPHRDIKPEDMQARNQRGPMQIIVAKHRDGEIGPAEVEFVPEWTTFVCRTDVPEPPRDWQTRGEE